MAADPTTTTYSACNVHVTYLGHLFESLGTGEDAISVVLDEDMIDQDVGMQGDGVLSINCNSSGEVTVRVLYGSKTNEFLSKKVNGYRRGALPLGDLVIREVGSESRVVAKGAYIAKAPDFTRGTKAGEVEWRFRSTNVEIYHAGPSVQTGAA